jgi:DNA-binding NarL/FixJ family response regulator
MYRPLSLPPIRILIADRSAYSRAVIRETLFAAGIRHLRPAQDQVSAMAQLAASRIDLAVADWALVTAGDGALLAALAGPGGATARPIGLLAIMAEATRRQVEDARRKGARAILLRPFSPAALVGRLARLARESAWDDDEIVIR